MRPSAVILALAWALAAVPPAHAWGDFEYAVLGGDGRSTISTSSDRWDTLGRLDDAGGELFWFVDDGREYVVRDPALVAEAQRIVRPMQELGRKQGKLGARQGRLGAAQGRLGARQGRLGARQGALSARLARIAHRVDGDDADSRALRREIRELEGEISELAALQREIAREQRPLSEEQRRLGEEQREIGDRQRRAAREAEEGLKRLAARALSENRAERLR